MLPRGVTGGVGCVWGRCVTRGVGVRKGVRGVMRCRGVSCEVSVTGEVSAPTDGSHGSVGGGVNGLGAVEPQGGSQWRGADQAQRPGRRGPQHALTSRGHTAQSLKPHTDYDTPMCRHFLAHALSCSDARTCLGPTEPDDTTVKLLPLQHRTFWRDIFGLYED